MTDSQNPGYRPIAFEEASRRTFDGEITTTLWSAVAIWRRFLKFAKSDDRRRRFPEVAKKLGFDLDNPSGASSGAFRSFVAYVVAYTEREGQEDAEKFFRSRRELLKNLVERLDSEDAGGECLTALYAFFTLFEDDERDDFDEILSGAVSACEKRLSKKSATGRWDCSIIATAFSRVCEHVRGGTFARTCDTRMVDSVFSVLCGGNDVFLEKLVACFCDWKSPLPREDDFRGFCASAVDIAANATARRIERAAEDGKPLRKKDVPFLNSDLRVLIEKYGDARTLEKLERILESIVSSRAAGDESVSGRGVVL